MVQKQKDPRFTLPNHAGKREYSCQIIKPYTALRRSPAARGTLDTELLFGQGVDVYAIDKGWALVMVKPLIKSARRKHYVGYVKASALGQDMTASHVTRVTALSAPIFSQANIKSHILMALPMNSVVGILSEDETFARLGRGYVHRNHIMQERQTIDFTAVAERFIGRPYIWGGTGGVGVDCSGLVQMSLCAIGVDAPRDADQQELNLGHDILGHDIETPQYQRGDLLFWAGHVGIMQNSQRLLHANAFHMETASEPLSTTVNRIGPPRRAKRLRNKP
ncbi:MAG: NlpC/P60 family protein [Litorimonas sp.]